MPSFGDFKITKRCPVGLGNYTGRDVMFKMRTCGDVSREQMRKEIAKDFKESWRLMAKI
jgi:hypothetical protein